MSESALRPQPWLRRMSGRDPGEERRIASPLELLFDLSVAVAVAQASAQLQEALAEKQINNALDGYFVVFFGLWWAWASFTWFASAYDTDDVPYRLLTLVQMAGVLVYAAGTPSAVERSDYAMIVVGYVIMRLALVAQWLRAAHDDPAGRSGTLRFAAAITGVQLCWVGRLFLPMLLGRIGLAVLIGAELAIPVWAQYTGRGLPWHPGHIIERYGKFTIIVLGEVIFAIAAAVQKTMSHNLPSPSVLAAAGTGLLFVFTFWSSYFKYNATQSIRELLRQRYLWAFGHFPIFGSIAAIGTGFQIVIGTLGHDTRVSAFFAACTVAIPAATFTIVRGLLDPRIREDPVGLGLTLLTAALFLVVAAVVSILSLSLLASVVIMVVLVILLHAYNLISARRLTHSSLGPNESPGFSG